MYGSKITGSGTANWNYVNFYKMDKPAQTIILADTVGTNSTDKNKQIHGFNFLTGYSGRIHLRHNGLANLSFADGHIAACDKTKIKQAALAEMDPSTAVWVVEADGTPVQINP